MSTATRNFGGYSVQGVPADRYRLYWSLATVEGAYRYGTHSEFVAWYGRDVMFRPDGSAYLPARGNALERLGVPAAEPHEFTPAESLELRSWLQELGDGDEWLRAVKEQAADDKRPCEERGYHRCDCGCGAHVPTIGPVDRVYGLCRDCGCDLHPGRSPQGGDALQPCNVHLARLQCPTVPAGRNH